jgi:hypothetical protein
MDFCCLDGLHCFSGWVDLVLNRELGKGRRSAMMMYCVGSMKNGAWRDEAVILLAHRQIHKYA